MTKAGASRALTAALLFGMSTPVAKGLLGNVSPQMLAGLLYLGSGLGLSAVWLAGRATRQNREATIVISDLPWLCGAIVFGGVLAPLLVMSGLDRTTASVSALLLNLEAVFTALIAWIVFSENVDRRIFVGMVAIVAGGIVLSWSGQPSWVGISGPLLIALGCLSWAIDNNFSQKVSARDPVQTASIKGVVAGLTNLGVALAVGAKAPPVAYVAGSLIVGFLSYGVSLVLYVLAMRELGTARTGAYFSLAPFVGAAVSLVVWRENVSISFLVAGVLMGIGLWLHLTERHSHRHVHEPMTHTHRHVHDKHHRHRHFPGQDSAEPHSHEHTHEGLVHTHEHFPDIHHRHAHDD
jgi:drug/metabolite transporter (DMT)-like permease